MKNQDWSKGMDGIKPFLIVVGLLAVLAAVLAGCAAAKAKNKDQVQFLTLFAFNYTDRYLWDITVDGMWMGPSSAYTNGGSAMGPRPPSKRNKQHTVRVRWELSDRYDLATNKYIEVGPLEQREADVPLRFPYPEHPNMLVLHFYPDGHVEAELTEVGQNHWKLRRFPVPKEHKAYVHYVQGSN